MSKKIVVKRRNLTFELNWDGVRELLQGNAMQKVLAEEAAKKARSAGPGYASSVHITEQRAIANIYPDSDEAAQDNYENNTLLKVIG